MNKSVAVVTDSTAYLPESVRKELSIEMVPLNVVFGEESFQEEKDLTTEEFYEKMTTTEDLPKTSQPAIGDFVTLYEELANKGYKQVVSIHISSKISGTYQAAMAAANMVRGIDVYGFDTEISSAPQGYYTVEAAKMANECADAVAILEKLKEMKKTSKAYIMVDDLSHLHRGGRLNTAQLVVGSLLKIKPILIFEEGRIVPFEKVRTEKKALTRILGLLEADVEQGGTFDATVIHANRLDDAEKLAATIQGQFEDVTVDISHLGPVLGTHLGPGSLAICWKKK
ncbi:DegV family protein [Halalkalibacter kiskunsagensis]|uniref:DegV family protein n=1 Tax=Halalkalibacter kiskunsagensis TaxID=1548599 RepID=A0ABV6K9G7_9BACI